MITENIIITVCEHTHNEVLFDVVNDICLHSDTIEEDLAEVHKFREAQK